MAATIVLIVVGGGLALVLRGHNGGSDSTRGVGSTSTAGEIAFASDRDGTSHIYTIKSDGSDLRQLTSGTGEDFGPSWSPDGSKLAFFHVASVPPPPFGATIEPRAIWVVNADGSGLTNLTPGQTPALITTPVWSPDGRQIAFTCRVSDQSLDAAQICAIHADGSGLRRLLPADARMAGSFPVWLPDNRTILFDGGSAFHPQGIYAIDSVGTNLHPIKTFGTGGFNFAVSPDGTQIAYILGQKDLYVMATDGSNARRIETGDFGPYSDLSWSADGGQLRFVGWKPSDPGSSTRWVLSVAVNGNISPTEITTIGIGPGPAWSPDGREFAYINLMEVPGTPPSPASYTELELFMRATGSRRGLLTVYASTPNGLPIYPPAWRPAPTT